jgi:hypothetical protein
VRGRHFAPPMVQPCSPVESPDLLDGDPRHHPHGHARDSLGLKRQDFLAPLQLPAVLGR